MSLGGPEKLVEGPATPIFLSWSKTSLTRRQHQGVTTVSEFKRQRNGRVAKLHPPGKPHYVPEISVTNYFPFVPNAKVPNDIQRLGEPRRIIYKNNLRFRGVYSQARQTAARDFRGVMNRYHDRHGSAGLNVFKRPLELFTAREQRGYEPPRHLKFAHTLENNPP
jgi:hypothetical protein